MSIYTTLVKNIAFFKDPTKEVYKKAFLFQMIEDLPFNPMCCAKNAKLNLKIAGERICATVMRPEWYKWTRELTSHSLMSVSYDLWTEVAFDSLEEYARIKELIMCDESKNWTILSLDNFSRNWWEL